MSPNRKKRQERYGHSPVRYEADPTAGLCAPHGWGVRKSAGYDVQQIIMRKNPTRLELRSEEIDDREPAPWATPYWFAGAK